MREVVCLCVCMIVSMSVYTYACTCMYNLYSMCVYMYMYVCMYVCVCIMYVIMYVCMLCMYVCMYVCMCVCMHLCMACMYGICVYIHIFTQGIDRWGKNNKSIVQLSLICNAFQANVCLILWIYTHYLHKQSLTTSIHYIAHCDRFVSNLGNMCLEI